MEYCQHDLSPDRLKLDMNIYLTKINRLAQKILINDSYNFGIGRDAKILIPVVFLISYSYYTGAEKNNSLFVISPMIKYRTGNYQRVT
ncbi:MAG: hypothetical protein IPP30_14345 [Flavobacterium sp.]|nr:hypothetical protein [Flavobacterium sp.]